MKPIIKKTETTDRNYWKYLKSKLKREGSQLGSATTQFKFAAPDGKKRLANVFDYDDIIELAKCFPSKQANRFIEWFAYSDETIDGKSKSKVYALFDSSLLDTVEIGTVKVLQQIHSYLFWGLYDFAGQIRTLNIAKGGFRFSPVMFLENTLSSRGAREDILPPITAKCCAKTAMAKKQTNTDSHIRNSPSVFVQCT